MNVSKVCLSAIHKIVYNIGYVFVGVAELSFILWIYQRGDEMMDFNC